MGWVRRFVVFHGKRHPGELGEAEITAFLTHLAVKARVSASTQNQALSALLFLYRDVLARDLEWLGGVVRAKRPVRLPVVLSREEASALLRGLQGTPLLMASLLYGSGLRLLECCRLRVKDVDFDRNEITVRDGKGQKDRVTLLPARLAPALAGQIERVRRQHADDLRGGAWERGIAGRARSQVPSRGVGAGLAVGLPRLAFLRPRGERPAAAASSP